MHSNGVADPPGSNLTLEGMEPNPEPQASTAIAVEAAPEPVKLVVPVVDTEQDLEQLLEQVSGAVAIFEQSLGAILRGSLGRIRTNMKVEILTQLRGVFDGTLAVPLVMASAATKKKKAKVKAKSTGPKYEHPKECIAPGCSKPSCGPRFRNLCEGHKGADPNQIAIWKAATKEQRSAAQ